MGGFVRVRTVRPLDGFRLHLEFTDGSAGVVDLATHLWGPVYESVRTDRRVFEGVGVDQELGTIVWPGGADLDPDFLYALAHPAPARS